MSRASGNSRKILISVGKKVVLTISESGTSIRYLGQDPSLFRDRIREHHIERGNAVVAMIRRLSPGRRYQDLSAFGLFSRFRLVSERSMFHHPSFRCSSAYFSILIGNAVFPERSTVNIRFS